MEKCPYCGAAATTAQPAPELSESSAKARCARCGNQFTPMARRDDEELAGLDEDRPGEDDGSAIAELLSEGKKLYREGKFAEAAVKFRAAADKAPHRKDVLAALAKTHSKNNQAYEALSAYLRILKIDPENTEALFKSGVLYTHQKRYSHGIEALRKLLAVEPENEPARLMLRIAEKGADSKAQTGRAPMAAGVTAGAGERAVPGWAELLAALGRDAWAAVLWLAVPVAIGVVYSMYSSNDGVMKGLLVAVLVYSVFASVVIHELGHGAAAFLLGDDTAEKAGRLTLDPVKHVSFIGMFVVPAALYLTAGFVFGWARPVPFDLGRVRGRPGGQAAVAGAGPMASLALSYAAFTVFIITAAIHNAAYHEAAVAYTVNLTAPFPVGDGAMAPVSFVMLELSAMVSVVSLLIGVFNLIPVAPLDGSWLLASILSPAWSTRIRRSLPIGIVAIVAAVYMGWITYLFYPAYIALAFYFLVSGAAL